MRILRSVATASLAAALAVSVPVTSASAATRANAAVPSAAAAPGTSAAVAVASDTWALWLIAALSAALVVRIATDDVKGPSFIEVISRG